MTTPHTYATRQKVGAVLFGLGILSGLVCLVFLFVAMPAFGGVLEEHLGAMLFGSVVALPAMVVYLTVPRLLDRYDPEPWYALVGGLAWGAIAACGFSAVINTIVSEMVAASMGQAVGEAAGVVISAPVVEEFWKCLGVFGIFYFLRREFDGMVDGVIYASFIAIGFAAFENVIYYARAALSGADVAVGATIFMRGVLSPWCHPLFTAMFGLGIGIARESTRPMLKWFAPLVGYLAAVFLHALWNGSALIFGATGQEGFFAVALLLWLGFVVSFLCIVIFLVKRRGKIIRDYLQDEVAIGTITASELGLVASAWGIWRAQRLYGSRGREFARTVARLALSKWHATRAMTAANQTVSFGMIGPLRQKIAELKRQQAQSAAGGQG